MYAVCAVFMYNLASGTFMDVLLWYYIVVGNVSVAIGKVSVGMGKMASEKDGTLGRIEKLLRRDGFNRRDVMAFSAAYAMATSSGFGIQRIGCVLVYGNNIIGTGTNKLKSDPVQHKYNRYRVFHNIGENDSTPPNHDSIHAEVSAIKSVPYNVAKSINWNRVKAYIYRIAPGLPYGQGLARPCPACQHALSDIGVTDVYYSTDFGFAHETFML